MVTAWIGRNLDDTKVRIKANASMVKEVDKFIYLESEINSKGKMERDFNIKIKTTLNSIKL
jgi:hypothetical protein